MIMHLHGIEYRCWIIGDRTLEEIIASEEYKHQNGDIYDAAGCLVSIDIG